MDMVIVGVGVVLALLVALACRRWLRHNEQRLIWLAYQLHGIVPMSQRNCYRSVHRNSFISIKEVRAAEQRVIALAHYLVVPLLTIVPVVTCWTIVR